MGNYRSILYENNKMLDYMIALARLKPGEKLHLSAQERQLISQYFNNEQKFYEFQTLIASSQFLNNYDDNNTFPSKNILIALFEEGKLYYYDESNDFIPDNYNDGPEKGIEITKDNLKGRPDEYERKFKIIRNAIAHGYYKIDEGKVVIDWDYGKQLGEEFSMKMDFEAFLSLTEVLTEKRFSKDSIDEEGYLITPIHYISIESKNALKKILPLCLRKVIIDGSLSELQKSEVKDHLAQVLFDRIQEQRTKNLILKANKGEKMRFTVNDSVDFTYMGEALQKASADLKYAAKIRRIKGNSSEIKYLEKYLDYYGDGFYKYGTSNKFTDKAKRMFKNQMLLEVLLLNSRDRLNINYSSFYLREALLKIKKDDTPFEKTGPVRFTGIAMLKNILVPKTQLIFEHLRKDKDQIKLPNTDMIDFLKSSSLKVQRNGVDVNLFAKNSDIGNQLANIAKIAKKLPDIARYQPYTVVQEKRLEIAQIRTRAFNTLDDQLFAHIRNSISHGNMDLINNGQELKVIFKDFKDEDDIPDTNKRNRNVTRDKRSIPDFYCEMSLDDYLKLCEHLEKIYFKEEDKKGLENINGKTIPKRIRYFAMSPVKPMVNRKMFSDVIKGKYCTPATAEYTVARMLQHMKDKRIKMLAGYRF